MDIKIASRFRPFSHLPGTRFLLPQSSISVQIFPSLLSFKDFTKSEGEIFKQITLDVEGPVEDFTIMQDLERMCLRVWGEGKKGYFRYRIEAAPDLAVRIVIEKGKISFSSLSEDSKLLQQDENLYSFPCRSSEFIQTGSLERLSLGNHKAQDVNQIRSRLDFSEILPLWHRLGQTSPACKITSDAGTLNLLSVCEKSVYEESAEKFLFPFRNLFLAGFDSWLSPRLADSDFQGILPQKITTSAVVSPLPLLSQAKELIASLFIQHREGVIKLLPALPKEFHCGRFIHIPLGDWGEFSFEWSKKVVKKAVLKVLKNRHASLVCTKEEKVCRLRTSNKDRGIVYRIGDPLNVVAGQHYWFDNFEK